MKEIEETDEWSCFVCNKDILKTHRAQHWALRNFMNKQLKKIQKSDFNDEDEVNNLLNEDSSKCCPRKKRKAIAKPVAAPVKRVPPMTREYMTIQPPAKKPHIQTTPKPRVSVTPKISPRTYANSRNSEIVCTPDILGLLNENDDSAIPKTNMMPSTSVAPPPLILRNNQMKQQRPIQPAPAQVPSPIYHNVNGFQIDLNHAARQEIFRLPNGKLIQVRKQTAAPTAAPVAFRPSMASIAPRQPQFTIRQASPMTTTARMFRPQMPQARFQTTPQPQHRFTVNDKHGMTNHGISNSTTQPQATPVVATPTIISSVFTQQNGSISVARAPQPNTPFGKAKTEFEDRIINGMEICQHTINKMITLTNSSSFKQSRTFTDLKDLYIHLEYLFNYTADKFQTLRENLKTGKESLVKHDVASKEKCDNDELEIVEEKTDIIEVLSDADDEEAPLPEKEKPGPASTKRSFLKNVTQTTTDKTDSLDAEQTSGNDTAVRSSSSNSTADVENDSASKDSYDVSMAVIANDKKLKNKVVVKVEKLENTKNPLIKLFMSQLQEKLDKQSSAASSREGTPVKLLDFEITMDESVIEKEKSPLPVVEVQAVEIVDDDNEMVGKDSKEMSAHDELSGETRTDVGDETGTNDKSSLEETDSIQAETSGKLETPVAMEIADNNEQEIIDVNELIKENAEDISGNPGLENSTINIETVPKIDTTAPLELVEVDDESIINKSDSFLELTIQVISSDEDEKSSRKSNENKSPKESPTKSIDELEHGTNRKDIDKDQSEAEIHDVFLPVDHTEETKSHPKSSSVNNESLQNENCETKTIENGSVESPSESLAKETEKSPSDITSNGQIISEGKPVDDLLITESKTQDLIDDDKDMLDDFFDDLEEHVM